MTVLTGAKIVAQSGMLITRSQSGCSSDCDGEYNLITGVLKFRFTERKEGDWFRNDPNKGNSHLSMWPL